MRRNRGTVFVVTLAVLAGLVALVAGIAASHREGIHAEFRRLEDRRAQIMAEAGLQHAIAILQQQKIGNPAQKSDAWATVGSSAKTAYMLDTDLYRFQILDSGSRINLNTVAEDQLKRLPISREQVAAILDWREAKTTPRVDGAKDEYYNFLPNPYNAKLQTFDSVEELYLVKGFAPAVVSMNSSSANSAGQTLSIDMFTVDSSSADRSPDGSAKLNLSQATVDQLTALGISPEAANVIVQAHPNTLADALRLPGAQSAARTVADRTTAVTQPEQFGLLNINTAPSNALVTLPGVSSDIAESIVSHQSIGFKSLGELLDIPGIDAATLANFVDRVCVGSTSFCVRCIGTSGRSKVSIEATLKIDSSGQVHLNRMRYAPLGDMANGWHWDADASNKVDMGGDR